MTEDGTTDESCETGKVDVSDYTLKTRAEEALGLYRQTPTSATILAELIDEGDAIILEWWGDEDDDLLAGMVMETDTLREVLADVDSELREP